MSNPLEKCSRLLRFGGRGLLALGLLGFAGCQHAQSALFPAGDAAERILTLFWWMVAGGSLIWLAVAGLILYAMYFNPAPHDKRAGLFIIGGGAVFPVAVLGILLAFGLAMLPDLVARAPEGSQHIAVSGEQWWWRIRYETPEGEFIEVANEIHLPVGEPVEFTLHSPDVIHAFWIPSLGGKVDMIPGRINRLRLDPTRTGRFRGVCAEYCGASHALMAFDCIVEEREDFDRWLKHQASPAKTPTTSLALRGRDVFLASGCGSCHTVRGTDADGVIGPDLTHVGSRQSLAAGTLSNELLDFQKWVMETSEFKPGVHMPNFAMLSEEDLTALAAYLEGLE